MAYFDIADDTAHQTGRRWDSANNRFAAFDDPLNDLDKLTVGVYAKFRFHPSVELKGLYYFQDLDDGWKPVVGKEDSPSAWRAILDIDQDLLKFTSLWVEYAQIDNTFVYDNPEYANFDASPMIGLLDLGKESFVNGANPNYKGTSKYIFVKAAQKWNDKWDSWLRFNWADYDTKGWDDFTQYGLGIGYQLNPAVHFELGYDYAEYYDKTDDNLFRLQTIVNF
jgi:hypothetical protein